MAAAVGEIAKDNPYQDIVNDNGGDFIPLVCETFGVWSPYALSILGSIADRTIVRNGLPRKFARRQLLQQLSVTLWRYNAKMRWGLFYGTERNGTERNDGLNYGTEFFLKLKLAAYHCYTSYRWHFQLVNKRTPRKIKRT